MAIKYFVQVFGNAGDLIAVPDPTQGGGSVSYQQGYGPDYDLANTAPSYLPIARAQFNQLQNDITGAIQQLQQNGFPVFITTAMNDGTPFPYPVPAFVIGPSDGFIYFNTVPGNVTTPPNTGWTRWLNGENVRYFNFAADTGTANAYASAPNPACAALQDGDVFVINISHAQTGACTYDPNGLGALPIKTLANLDPTSGMMTIPGRFLLSYNLALNVFILINPYVAAPAAFTGVAVLKRTVITGTGAFTSDLFQIYADVELQGTGGGSGGINATGEMYGGGGGGGGYCKKLLNAATMGASQVVTIGNPGTAGAIAGNGGDGQACTFGALLTANGGKGGHGGLGMSTNYVPGGNGGTATGGDINITGANGGGGGTVLSGGAGGASFLGSTTFIQALAAAVNGNPGMGYGSGAAGACCQSGGGTGTGAVGAPGVCIVTEFCSQ